MTASTRHPVRFRARARRAPARRRGAIYLMVLVSSAIVMVVGVSALMAVRIEQRAAAGTSLAAEARAHARSAIELALLRIDDDPDWRDNHTHDQWSDEIPFAAGTLRYRFVDTVGSDLAADPATRVWLYGRAEHGAIARTTRVLLEPTAALPGANLLRNAHMEDGTRHWWTDTDAGAELRRTDHDAQSGDGSLYLKHRSSEAIGVSQDVTDRLESGITYELSAWVRMPDENDHMIFELYTRDTVNGEQRHVGVSDKVAGNPWRHVSATLTPEWGGTLEEAIWRMYSETESAAFFIDEATLMPVTHGHHMTPVPGTWAQVVD